jgi:hypothetical protein
MKTKRKAITLIETVVYLALFSAIFIVIVQFGLRILSFNSFSLHSNEIQKAGLFTRQHFRSQFGQAVSINEAESVFDTSPGTLTLSLGSGDVTYSVLDSRLAQQSGANTYYLTPDGYNVTQLMFEPLRDTENIVYGIRTTLILQYEDNALVEQTLQMLNIL